MAGKTGMNAPDKAFLSRQYNNRELVPDHPQYFARWTEASARAASTMAAQLDRRYGSMPGEAVDIFPARKGDGSCMMFIHGGYWRSLDKKNFSFLAPAWVDAGVSLAVVNYDLCPGVTMDEIVRQMLRASRWLWLHAEDYGMDRDRLYVSGHSAGGHLVAMLMSTDWAASGLPADVIRAGCGISGLYDLEPIRLSYLNDVLRLTPEVARLHSPIHHAPSRAGRLLLTVGALEGPEYLRQSEALARAWSSRGLRSETVEMAGHHHFSIVAELEDPKSELSRRLARQMELA